MTSTVKKSGKKTTRKQRSEISGSFQMKARRERIVPQKVLGRSSASCPECGAVYTDKHWHACRNAGCRMRAAALPKMLCEVCRFRVGRVGNKDSDYAGEVVVEGLASPQERYEVRRLAINVGQRASNRDPQDRIVDMSDSRGRLVIRTSENQLAVSIGKQIDRARKGGQLTIVWSKADKPVRVTWKARK